MSIFEALRLALAQLRVQKLKSFFTLTGVMVGVTFLIAVVSVVEGMGRYMEQDLIGKLMAVNSFQVLKSPDISFGDMDEFTMNEYRRRPPITERDTITIIDALPTGFRYTITNGINAQLASKYTTRPRSAQIQMVTSPYFEIKNLGMANGRAFTEQEDVHGTPVAVIGKDVREHFFPGVDPLDRTLRIGSIPYRVVGVAESQGSTFGISLDRFVIIPFNSPARQYRTGEPGAIDGMIVQAPDRFSLPNGEEAVRQALRVQRKLRPAQPDNFAIQTPDAALSFWNKIRGYLVLAGAILPAIGLLVGAIVIMNIMLMTVAQRTHEIGLRKSLGARRRDILAQFLIEATTLSIIGSALGVLCGARLGMLVSALTPLPTHVAPWSVAVAVCLGAGVGIVAGVYPASRAARLDPIAALRAE